MNGLKEVKQVNLPGFGDCQIMENEKKQAFIVKDVLVLREQQFSSQNQLVELCIQNSHPNLTRILNYSAFNEEAFCLRAYKIIELFAYPDCTLFELILQKQQKNAVFTSDQIWRFLENMTSALSFLQMRKVVHGNVSPHMIYFSKKSRSFSLVDPRLFQLQNKYEVIHEQVNQVAATNSTQSDLAYLFQGQYLSPEQLALLHKKEGVTFYNSLDKFKSDVFTLGMVTLFMTSMRDSDQIYRVSEGRIDFHLID